MTIRGPDRVPRPRQAVHRQPARGRRRDDELRPGAQERARARIPTCPGRQMRDSETIETALTAAETGHLVSQLHTLDATETISASSPPSRPPESRSGCSSDRCCAAWFAAPVPRADGKRAAWRRSRCCGQLARARDGGGQGPHQGISTAMRRATRPNGMQTFDTVLMLLFRQNVITYERPAQSSNPTTSRCAPPASAGPATRRGTTSTRRTRRPRTARHRPAPPRPARRAPSPPGAASRPPRSRRRDSPATTTSDRTLLD